MKQPKKGTTVPVTNSGETWDTEQVLAYVYDVKPWRELEADEQAEWCRRVKYIRDNVTTDGERWTNERLAGLFGIARRSLVDRFTTSERRSGGGGAPQHRSPGKQAGDTRRFLANPDVDAEQKAAVVAEAIGNDPELMSAIYRAQADKVESVVNKARAEWIENRRETTAQRKAADPVGRKFDERIALHDLQLQVNKFVQKAEALIPEIGLIPDGERYWLEGEAERLEYVAGELRYMAENGETRMDAELRAVTEAG